MYWRACLLCLLALGVVACAGRSAPAPFTPTVVGDTLVGVQDRNLTPRVQQRLRSRDFLEAVLRDEALRQLITHQRIDPAGWLAERLRVETIRGGTGLRIGMVDCEVGEALPLLSAVVQAYLGETYPGRREKLHRYQEMRKRLESLGQLRGLGRKMVLDEEYREVRSRTEALRNELSAQERLILRGPRARHLSR